MSHSPDVLILGGGVIGLTTAYYLDREGFSVAVIDKGEMGKEASWAGAGIIPPGNPDRTSAPYEKLRALSSAMYPGLSRELLEATGIGNGYFVCGGLEWLEADEESIVEAWRDEGIEFVYAEPGQIRQLQPALSAECSSAYFLPGMAQVRNPRHLKALLAWCSGRVELLPHHIVQAFERKGDRVIAAITGTSRFQANQFLIATGAWTDGILSQIGLQAGIHPVRGQIALLNTGQPLLTRILLQGRRYLVSRNDSRVLVGSTEEDAGFEKRTTAFAIQELLTFAQSLVPGLARAEVEKCWAGLRPGSSDGLPFLGRVPGFDNLFVAAGHFRSGIQLSPATGLVMAELMVGKKPTIPLDRFSMDRRPAPLGQTAFRS
ncbi:MAG: NAD(P)/FAD-dependent oxidoreductase [Gemmataceae bacterium]